MRIAVLLIAGFVGGAAWASPADAVPLSPSPPVAAPRIVEVGGVCGPHRHWVPPHINRYGRPVPGHCRWYRHRHWHHHRHY